MAKASEFRWLTKGRYINDITQAVISQRQYYKLKRGGLNNEQLAKLNRQVDETAQLIRPARGRSSLLKIVPDLAKDIAAARKEEKQRKESEKILQKELARSERKIDQIKNRKYRKRNITNQMLRPGRMGVRIRIEDYSDYVRLFDQAKKNGNIFAYALGWYGVDTRPGIPASKIEKSITVFTLHVFDRPHTEKKWNMEFSNSIESHAYVEFVGFWMHLKFASEYASKLAEKHNIKRKYK